MGGSGDHVLMSGFREKAGPISRGLDSLRGVEMVMVIFIYLLLLLFFIFSGYGFFSSSF